jgi:serine/threonine protein kinase
VANGREKGVAMTATDVGPVGNATELPGRLGGDYVVERLLGQGPLGTLLLARGSRSGRPVLVKILAGELAGDEAVRTRFLRTAELDMRLSHPNVVRVFEAGVDKRPYLVMEHIDGETPAQRLQRVGAFSADESIRLATHLAAGLTHAHASGVVHGALHLHSIVLGDDGVARICDLGFARLCGWINRTGPAGQAGDVYALAAVLRQVGGDRLPPWLTALVDAGLAAPSVRPSAFDLFHEVLTKTSPPGVWVAGDAGLAAADESQAKRTSSLRALPLADCSRTSPARGQ